MTIDDEPILDMAVLAELRSATGDDGAFILELVETFVTEGAANLEGMIAAATAGDAAAIVRPAHTLKSSSASLGAMRLSAICRSIEAAGRDDRGDGLAEDVAAARTAWQATLAAFTAAGLSR
jgi:HPt (histidine-containing phosphotransfer) domain-containing protein